MVITSFPSWFVIDKPLMLFVILLHFQQRSNEVIISALSFSPCLGKYFNNPDKEPLINSSIGILKRWLKN